MSLLVASESEVRMQLWLSFISVLKSYAAVANLEGQGSQMSNLDDSPCGIIWSSACRDERRRCSLGISYDTQTGRGHWHLHAGDAAPFSGKHDSTLMRDLALNLDGTVALDGSILDMDHAAIELMGWFANTIKTGRIEVPA